MPEIDLYELAKKLAKIYEPSIYWGQMYESYRIQYLILAKHVAIMVLEARLDEQYRNVDWGRTRSIRIEELTNQINKLKG